MGHERCQLRWDYYGQQTAYVQQWLCFHLWSASLFLTIISPSLDLRLRLLDL